MSKQRNYRFPKERAGIHPELMADFVPLKAFKPKDSDANNYDGLNDDSPFSHYAWGFLRRNRFYQNSFDKTKPQFADIAIWGHKPSANSPAINGLTVAKGYWEKEPRLGIALSWEGIHSFFDAAFAFRRTPTRPEERIQVANVQVPLVFDIDPLHGPNRSAIDIQLQIARAILYERAEELELGVKRSKSAPSEAKLVSIKRELRTLLRVADLLSPEYENSEGETRKNNMRKVVWGTSEKRPSLAEVAEKLPDSDIGRKTEKNKGVSDLLDDVYDLVYEWKLLHLLHYDHWDRHFFPSTNNEAADHGQ